MIKKRSKGEGVWKIGGCVVRVPHGWAHAVLNLETSVGVAVEFSSVLQE